MKKGNGCCCWKVVHFLQLRNWHNLNYVLPDSASIPITLVQAAVITQQIFNLKILKPARFCRLKACLKNSRQGLYNGIHRKGKLRLQIQQTKTFPYGSLMLAPKPQNNW